MLVMILMVHVACNGLNFIIDADRNCVSETSLTYVSENECNAAIKDRSIPYLGVPYPDLFCQWRYVEK